MTNNQSLNGWDYYTVDTVAHSEVDDASGHIWQCTKKTYDEGAPAGVPTPDAGLLTTVQTYSSVNCAGQTNPLTTTYSGYDQYGNVVATVDPLAAANPSLYSSQGV